MSFIESTKTYSGRDLENIFFRPMLCGPTAQDLGVRILYNMPNSTTVQIWDGKNNVLQRYTKAGWNGGKVSVKGQRTIALERVKAELGFSAADYFSMVYEQLMNRSGMSIDDLSGTELEQAETELFKRAIAESIRVTMWMGNMDAEEGFTTFNGFLKSVVDYAESGYCGTATYSSAELDSEDGVIKIFESMWENSDNHLKDLKGEGQLAIYVTSDIYHAYEKYLDRKGVDSAYTEMVNGRQALAYHGIPVIDLHINAYLIEQDVFPHSFCLLTDRRNLVLAVNTADFPGTEVRMWYNPDLMENRQRATFMAGCQILDERILTFAQLVG